MSRSWMFRRLRLHGLIERIPKTHRYRLTAFGFKTVAGLKAGIPSTLLPQKN